MKKLLVLSTLLLCSFFQVSCSIDGVTNNPAPTNPVDVYVAGSKNGQACYWKNGQIVMLDSGGFENITIKKIIVSDGDVYVLGTGVSNSFGGTLFWKNGVLSNLSSEYSTINYGISITDFEIIGNDIYFVGYIYQKPFDINAPSKLVYWKNNDKVVVDTFDSYVFSQSSIKIVNNNIYILSSRDGGTGIKGYYINNVFVEMPNNTNLNRVFAVDNNDVYISGTTNSNSFVKNIVNNNMITNPNSIGSLLTFDNNGNKYHTTNNKIYKNDNVIFENTTNSCLKFFELKVVNDNLYMLNLCDYDIDPRANTIDINGINTLQTAIGELFSSLFIVQN